MQLVQNAAGSYPTVKQMTELLLSSMCVLSKYFFLPIKPFIVWLLLIWQISSALFSTPDLSNPSPNSSWQSHVQGNSDRVITDFHGFPQALEHAT